MRVTIVVVAAFPLALLIGTGLVGPGVPVISSAAAAQVVRSAQPPALLEEGQEIRLLAPDQGHLRRRVTRLNAGLLGSIEAGMMPALTLNLFQDVVLTAVFERMEETNPGLVWVGRLEDDPLSLVTLAVVEGVLSGHVSSPGGLYEITADADGAAVVSEVDAAQIRELPPVPVAPSAVRPETGAGAPDVEAVGHVTITVANFYTQAVRRRAGGAAAIKASIAGNIARANTAYTNSGIKQRLRQVRVQQISYRETGNVGTDLDRLGNQNDGFLDAVHGIRDQRKADLVALIVAQGKGLCGIANTPFGRPFDTAAFSVTAISAGAGFVSCIIGFTYAHELGHNQGNRHDWFVSDNKAPGSFPYSHGHVDVKKRINTIMAYNNRCAAGGFSCETVGFFSNPAKRTQGVNLGVSGSKTSCKAGKTSPSNCAANNVLSMN